ncbi:MAG: anhydro-N-acetylmuramic acid kinase [Hyphomicrobiales bacterium]|nr:anhydro-N-acetylmuramic acid kinase [Hyphomicrobiales bacterium]
MARIRRTIGLMSGTSMDGVDAALIHTDGIEVFAYGATIARPYTDEERSVLRAALVAARCVEDRSARPGALAKAEAIVTNAHAETVEKLLAQTSIEAATIDVIGFHGQTVLHDPAAQLTIQIGDGEKLAARLRIPVVYDFRAADIAAGGEGAPLVCVFHRALAQGAGLRRPVVVINIGGVANATMILDDGSLIACDTGPGNALLDDFIAERMGQPMDRDGAIAGAGQVDEQLLARLLDDPYFDRPAPKSLDRDHFSRSALASLSTENGAATLAAFTADSIAKTVAQFGETPRAAIVCGGGVHNPAILSRLTMRLGCPVKTADKLGWSADFLEAQAFAFLAVRSLEGLPLSFPGTTGVATPMTGGVLTTG